MGDLSLSLEVCQLNLIVCHLTEVALIIKFLLLLSNRKVYLFIYIIAGTFLKDLFELVEILRKEYSLFGSSIELNLILNVPISEKPALQVAVLERQHADMILLQLILYELFLVDKGTKLTRFLVHIHIWESREVWSTHQGSLLILLIYFHDQKHFETSSFFNFRAYFDLSAHGLDDSFGYV